jgi:hypothetical protein
LDPLLYIATPAVLEIDGVTLIFTGKGRLNMDLVVEITLPDAKYV